MSQVKFETITSVAVSINAGLAYCLVGEIKKNIKGKFQYRPQGSVRSGWGKEFDTIAACKKSLLS